MNKTAQAKPTAKKAAAKKVAKPAAKPVKEEAHVPSVKEQVAEHMTQIKDAVAQVKRSRNLAAKSVASITEAVVGLPKAKAAALTELVEALTAALDVQASSLRVVDRNAKLITGLL